MNTTTRGPLALSLALLGAVAWAGCDLLDPSNVDNPNITEETYLGLTNPITPWVNNLERQTAIALNQFVTTAELTTDNYVNTSTFYNQNVDKGNFNYADADLQNTFAQFARLRESARYGRTVVAPADTLTTADQRAELYFYEGIAQLYLGEIYEAAPDTASGPAVASSALIDGAIAAFQQAVTLTTNATNRAGYQIALARAYWNKGDRANARTAATAGLAGSATYLRQVRYDATNGPVSTIQDALFDRGNFDDLQPLPRLDFLDPKFYSPNSSTDTPFSLVKAEEAHLILIEADLADGLVDAAKTRMAMLVALANGRAKATFSDNVEGRTHAAPGSRPNTRDWKVAASAADSLRSNLVLTRNGTNVTVSVSTISATSVTPAIVAALKTVEDAVGVLYLLRQEIFMAEGRRMNDLGIKWPLSRVEFDANANLGSLAKQTARVPAFLPAVSAFDAYTATTATKQAVITHNLNRVLAQNRTAPEVVPFF